MCRRDRNSEVLTAQSVECNENVAKISIIGAGMTSNPVSYTHLSLIKSKDNREIASKHLLTVCQKCIMQRKIFNHL